MIHEDPRQIKVIKVDKLKGTKPQDTRKVEDIKLLDGRNSIDYRKDAK